MQKGSAKTLTCGSPLVGWGLIEMSSPPNTVQTNTRVVSLCGFCVFFFFVVDLFIMVKIGEMEIVMKMRRKSW